LYDVNPTYSFSYQVADEEEQTYIKHAEARDDDVVTGEYSYVDPLGSLIVVKYTAGPDGYAETREAQSNTITIRAKGDKPAVAPAGAIAVVPAARPRPVPVAPVVTEAPAAQSNEDLIAQIIAQLTPFIKSTVSSSLGSSASTVTETVRSAQPQVLTNVFGRSGGNNNVRVATPNFDFAYDLQK
jgi:hypothetical protein